jgi:hypothetical protein
VSSSTAISSISCNSTLNCVLVGMQNRSPVTVSTLNGTVTRTSGVSSQVRTQKDVTR